MIGLEAAGSIVLARETGVEMRSNRKEFRAEERRKNG